MKVKFLGQGLESTNDNTVGEILVNSLLSNDYNEAIWISAFSSEAIFNQLKDSVLKYKENGKIKIIVGIDQEGTSFGALSKLLSLQVDSYVYHHSGPTIFHPKCYIFKGSNRFRIIIGSSNLTVNGLFNNIENSILVEFEKDDLQGMQFYNEVLAFYKDILDVKSLNVKRLSIDLIQELHKLKLIPRNVSKSITGGKESKSKIVIDRIKELFPSLSRRMYRGLKKTKKKTEYGSENLQKPGVVNDPAYGVTLWTKNNLPGSDVEFTRTGTNPTGRLKLVKAGHDIDQTDYFRNEIFKNLKWIKRSNNNKEDASGRFRIIIDKVDYGIYNLQITHNPSGDAGQNNYTTSISWSGVSDLIKKNDLRGKNLAIYKSSDLNYDFIIEIA
jgi:HKD family nuclease